MTSPSPDADHAAENRPRYEPLGTPAWPRGARAAVSLTFDVDGETGLPADSPRAPSLSAVSERLYGLRRGLDRILDLLERSDVHATFYVPGAIADRHPDAVRAILAGGHEVGHHGHRHLSPNRVDEQLQRAEIERGIASLEAVAGQRPEGYRSPCWELTQATYDLLCEHGFAYDSSCMEDDRPYRCQHPSGSLLEFPVHWCLDDWPYFSFSGESGGNLSAPSTPAEVWARELEVVRTERRHVTFTLHPEVIGRGNRLTALESLIGAAREAGDVAFITHGELARLLQDPVREGTAA